MLVQVLSAQPSAISPAERRQRLTSSDHSVDCVRLVAALLRHLSEDTLVGWAWAPGRGKRTPAPGTQAEFGALMRAWAESGAVCPAE